MDINQRFHELSEQAKRYSKAKANSVYLDHFRKSKLAILMKKYEPDNPTVSAQEREARADQEYLEVLDGLREATETAEYERWELKLVEMKFEAWRTQQATKRVEMNL